MTDPNELESAAGEYLDEAISDIKESGRYWCDSMSRPTAEALERLVSHELPNIICLSLKPDWEHVIFDRTRVTPEEMGVEALNRFNRQDE